MPLIQLSEVHKEYHVGKQTIKALAGVNLSIERGEFTVIAGPSGSGKTTLLNIIGMLDCKTTGHYYLDGTAIEEPDFDKLAWKRNTYIGFIFQNFNLMKLLNVTENIEMPLLISNNHKSVSKSMIDDLIRAVGLDAYRNQKPDELSGGQQQRIAIARALITQPLIVLADEPTANLDSHTATSIIELMQEINRQRKITFLFSTHDNRLISQARRVVELRDGVVVS
ncbi:MAG: ABC transporter ATP-binding protein [Chitinivibrionales bacterium]|nr:ABC transporter ATP-binding protein [Chitinivibrionales bacterium]